MYFYSKSTNSFYPEHLVHDYKKAQTFPDDAVKIEDSVYEKYGAGEVPLGKIRVAGADGPVWGDAPEPTDEQIFQENTKKFKKLLRTTTDSAFPLQSAQALGIITELQQSELNELQTYAVELTKIDLRQNPVNWPMPPKSIKFN